MTDTLYRFDEKERFSFPVENMHRVTAGHGGEAFIIEGTDKTALYDTGMAYCGNQLVSNICKTTSRLDYIILSHSHYDHIGALPYVRKAFPGAEVLGSEKSSRILSKSSARELMVKLGIEARNLYSPESSEEIPLEGLSVDRVIGDGNFIELGGCTMTCIETKGHTDCSLSFMLEPAHLLITSESTGILEHGDYVHTPILKSFPQAIEAARRCKALNPKRICLPHFGMLPEEMTADYFDSFIEECFRKKEYIDAMAAGGMNCDKILEEYCSRYWTSDKEAEQPYEAFVINSGHIVRALLNWRI